MKMVTTRSTPGNKEVPDKPIPNHTAPNQPFPNQPFPNSEVQANYDRLEERITEGVIGAKKYPVLYEYDDVDPLSNLALLARAPRFDTVAFDEDFFVIGTRRTGSFVATFRYMHCKRPFGDRTYHVLTVM